MQQELTAVLAYAAGLMALQRAVNRHVTSVGEVAVVATKGGVTKLVI
jgi:hypothetical protein